VRADGVEGALRTLLRAGVYLTVDELKGRCPIVRGSMTFVASPASFRNPRARADILTTSGGSRGPRTRVRQDLAFVWEGVTSLLLTLEARGGLGWRFAVWGVPGGVAYGARLRAADTLAALLGVVAIGIVATQAVRLVERRLAGGRPA
jgi:hypothetical protein